ncbi:hypothetical protein [Dongia sp.]|uniref:hypothetical protein n=1 Tax=Dongia sp. TaxID=1977262 RepID=UPI0035AD8013
MAKDNGERHMAPAATPAQKPVLGAWQGNTFRFLSPAHERGWQQQAYRQSIDPDRWQQQPPVDHQTQALLDDMPHLGGGQYFHGPDGNYRRVTMELREDRDIADIRRKAFNELAQSGVTWKELAQYPDDKPHPGEAEALAVREARRSAADSTTKAAGANQANFRFGPTTAKPDLTRVAPDIGLDLGGDAANWGSPSKESGTAPVLVATTDKAVSGLPKEVEKSQPFVAPSPLNPGQRRSFNERLVGRHANDNNRSPANDNSPGVGVQSASTRNDRPAEKILPGMPIVVGAEAADDDKREVDDRLFNWKRKGYAAPEPSEYAIYSASDEGRFTYLEEMKDEWSRLLGQNPEKVFRSMAGEVEKLSNAAMQDFYTGYRRVAAPAERDEIVDAVMKMVFAPAEHWATPGNKPNETIVAQKPFLGVVRSTDISGSDLARAFSEAATLIEEGNIEKSGGRPGSKETRRIIAHVVKKLAKAIEACGGQVRSRFYGPNEKFLRSANGGTKGGSFADKLLEFEYNGKRIGFFGNHAGMYADGLTLKPNEANQISKLVENIAQGMRDGTLEIDAAGVGYFAKRKPSQSLKDYLRTVNDFVKKMVDCKRPFLIRIRVEKPQYPDQIPLNDNFER